MNTSSQTPANLQGKTLFITGASRGIGLAIAKRAAGDGANIVILAKTTEPNPKLPGTIYSAAKEIEAAGGRALPLPAGQTVWQSPQAQVQRQAVPADQVRPTAQKPDRPANRQRLYPARASGAERFAARSGYTARSGSAIRPRTRYGDFPRSQIRPQGCALRGAFCRLDQCRVRLLKSSGFAAPLAASLASTTKSTGGSVVLRSLKLSRTRRFKRFLSTAWRTFLRDMAKPSRGMFREFGR